MAKLRALSVPALALVLAACSNSSKPDPVSGPIGSADCVASASLTERFAATALDRRAYVVARDNDKVTVLDLDSLDVIGTLNTCSGGAHMAELSNDFSKIYVSASSKNEAVVVDAKTLKVTTRIPTGLHPTHLSMQKTGKYLALMNEESNSVSFIDPVKDVEVKRLDGFYTPHFARFTADGNYAYIANIAGHHITRVKLDTLSIDGQIPLDGFGLPPETPLAADEGGFADAQIDSSGILYAAHGETGRVLVYDTNKQEKVKELSVGPKPWIVYAEHPFTNIPNHVVPSFDDQSVALIAKTSLKVTALAGVADRQSYGVNYSSLAPGKAFVMNRIRRDITVLDTTTGKAIDTIAVGGTTETASTTPDGKFIIAAVSSSNSIAIIDATTSKVVKTIGNAGEYPWSVTIPNGQNYCH